MTDNRLPSIRQQINDSRLLEYSQFKKQSQGSNPYNEGTTASRHAKMTAEASMVTIGSREVSHDASSRQIAHNLSNLNVQSVATDRKLLQPNKKIFDKKDLANIFSDVMLKPMSRMIQSPQDSEEPRT